MQHIRDHQLLGTRFEPLLPGGEIVGHGLCWLYLDGAWWAADATLDAALCAQRGYRLATLERSRHTRLWSSTLAGDRHFEILGEVGPFADLPVGLTDMAVSLGPLWRELRGVSAASPPESC